MLVTTPENGVDLLMVLVTAEVDESVLVSSEVPELPSLVLVEVVVKAAQASEVKAVGVWRSTGKLSLDFNAPSSYFGRTCFVDATEGPRSRIAMQRCTKERVYILD